MMSDRDGTEEPITQRKRIAVAVSYSPPIPFNFIRAAVIAAIPSSSVFPVKSFDIRS
jgi:hypothetical protein